MMNIFFDALTKLTELMLKLISMLVNAVEAIGTSVGLTAHESHMLFVIAIGVSLGIQSAHSLERMRAKERKIEKAINEGAIDGMFNHITTKSLNKAAKAAEN